MANEEKYRVEAPEKEEEPEEKKGFLRPLPTREEPEYIEKDGRPQPIVKVLGVSMTERRKDLLIMLLVPALVGLIDTTIYSFIITARFESSATYLFFIPIIVAIPIGLTSAEAGKALISSVIGAFFFMIFFIIFLASPGLYVPELGIDAFILSALALSMVYFIMMVVATFLGTVVGVILREFF
ncbi:MAG: hypothetical protein AM325_001550 [Candidatus Thorarchaeota archaeon SMTZ1-45]|nr:MAG: hypothetical protein AM325_03360 [Candidatus Thorarchaeota archaeon SMTZ1-45]